MNESETTEIVEVRHKLSVGGMLPVDYAYGLYAALKGAVGEDHRFFDGFRLSTISLAATQDPTILRTHSGSYLAYRGPKERADLLRKALNGKPLIVGGGGILVNQGHFKNLLPSSRLGSHFVAYGDGGVDQYKERLHKDLREKYGVEPIQVLVHNKIRSRKMKKYTAEVFGRRVYVEVSDPDASVAIQRHGLGPRASLGAGWFEKELRAPLWR